MEWKDIVLKAMFGAMQAAGAEFFAVQVCDLNTLYAAAAGALLRGGVEFLSELKKHFKAPVAAKQSASVKMHWFKRCW